MSWVRGNTIDPEELALIDLDAERTSFLEATGSTPEQWIAKSRARELPATASAMMRTYRALLLERRDVD
jgi:hypothetical protein